MTEASFLRVYEAVTHLEASAHPGDMLTNRDVHFCSPDSRRTSKFVSNCRRKLNIPCINREQSRGKQRKGTIFSTSLAEEYQDGEWRQQGVERVRVVPDYSCDVMEVTASLALLVLFCIWCSCGLFLIFLGVWLRWGALWLKCVCACACACACACLCACGLLTSGLAYEEVKAFLFCILFRHVNVKGS